MSYRKLFHAKSVAHRKSCWFSKKRSQKLLLLFHKGNNDPLNNLLLPLWKSKLGHRERAPVSFDERAKKG